MKWFNEKPSPQARSVQQVLDTSEHGYQLSLRRVFRKYGVLPNSVRTVLEPGCGAGSMTHALLSVCRSIQTIHAVDYGTVLQTELFDPQIVIPIIGLISTVIEQPPIRETLYDLIVCCAMSSNHGIKNWQLHLLAERLQPKGQLLTVGENGNFESGAYFRQTFTTRLNGNYDDDAVLWTKK